MRKIYNLVDFDNCFDYYQIETDDGLEYKMRGFSEQRLLIEGARFSTQPDHICSIQTALNKSNVDKYTKTFIELVSRYEDTEILPMFLDCKTHEVLIEYWDEDEWYFYDSIIVSYDEYLEDYMINPMEIGRWTKPFILDVLRDVYHFSDNEIQLASQMTIEKLRAHILSHTEGDEYEIESTNVKKLRKSLGELKAKN